MRKVSYPGIYEGSIFVEQKLVFLSKRAFTRSIEYQDDTCRRMGIIKYHRTHETL